ncbi:hypothetical protein ACLKA7_009421 [Drosophila subpalustris]
MLVRNILIFLVLPSCLVAQICTKKDKKSKKVIKECCNGYKKVPGRVLRCVAECKPCGSGKCVKPNICGCYKGYENLNNLAFNRCVPKCKGGCKNGQCESPEGYTKENENSCAPVCKDGCKNGECTAPGECTCNDGYSKENENSCVPVCKNGCKNGFCSAPEKCVCSDGYINEVENNCIPFCEMGCLNGTCVAPNKCHCPEGYRSIGGRGDISTDNACVPEIFQSDEVTTIGMEITDSVSINNEDKLAHICTGRCWNGTCVNEECICKINYRLTEDAFNSTKLVCLPVCEPECINGYCLYPNICICYDGMFPKDGYECPIYEDSEKASRAGIMNMNSLFITLIGISLILMIIICIVLYTFRERAYRVGNKEEQFGAYYSANKADVIRAQF